MKIFGIKLEIKKEPKWVSYEVFLELTRLVQDNCDGVELNRKGIETNRKRIERAKLPDNGEVKAADFPVQAVDHPVETLHLNPGDPPPPGMNF